jgi:hypothetical protein
MSKKSQSASGIAASGIAASGIAASGIAASTLLLPFFYPSSTLLLPLLGGEDLSGAKTSQIFWRGQPLGFRFISEGNVICAFSLWSQSFRVFVSILPANVSWSLGSVAGPVSFMGRRVEAVTTPGLERESVARDGLEWSCF